MAEYTCGHVAPIRCACIDAQVARLEAANERMAAALRESHHANRETVTALIVVRPRLEEPYSDDPHWSPWTRLFDRSESSPWRLLIKADASARAALSDGARAGWSRCGKPWTT